MSDAHDLYGPLRRKDALLESRQFVRVHLSENALAEMVQRQAWVDAELPDDAIFVRAIADPMTMGVSVLFAHESFARVPPGAVPMFWAYTYQIWKEG